MAAEPIVRRVLNDLDNSSVNMRRWMSCFGAKPAVMAELWTMIDPENTMPNGVKPAHITWAFYYLKQYPTEEVLARNVGGFDEQTCRKWIWLFIEAISYQEYRVVSSLEYSLLMPILSTVMLMPLSSTLKDYLEQ